MRRLLTIVAALLLVHAAYRAWRDADRAPALVDEPFDALPDDPEDDGDEESDTTSRGDAFDAPPSHGYVPALATE